MSRLDYERIREIVSELLIKLGLVTLYAFRFRNGMQCGNCIRLFGVVNNWLNLGVVRLSSTLKSSRSAFGNTRAKAAPFATVGNRVRVCVYN